jgi:hypothetical protein
MKAIEGRVLLSDSDLSNVSAGMIAVFRNSGGRIGMSNQTTAPAPFSNREFVKSVVEGGVTGAFSAAAAAGPQAAGAGALGGSLLRGMGYCIGNGFQSMNGPSPSSNINSYTSSALPFAPIYKRLYM